MGIDNAAARAKSTAHDVLAFGQRQVDRAVLPETRQRAYEGVSAFAQEKPILFSLIATQVLFASLPILCFATFVLSLAGLAFASALLFALFWTGIALFVFLVPALLLASAVSALVWAWAISAFLVTRWAYQKTQTQTTASTTTPKTNKSVVVRSGGDDGGHVVFSPTNPDPGLTDVNGGSNDDGGKTVAKTEETARTDE